MFSVSAVTGILIVAFLFICAHVFFPLWKKGKNSSKSEKHLFATLLFYAKIIIIICLQHKNVSLIVHQGYSTMQR